MIFSPSISLKCRLLFHEVADACCANSRHCDISDRTSNTSDVNRAQSDSLRPIKLLSEYTPLIKEVSSLHKSSLILKDNLFSVVEAVKRLDVQSERSICEL